MSLVQQSTLSEKYCVDLTWCSAFWCTGPLGLVQHEDFWDTLAANIDVYREDVSVLEPHHIVLNNGIKLAADAILCGTGWDTRCRLFSESMTIALGLPHNPEDDDPKTRQHWDTLLASADAEILSRFPILEDPPINESPAITSTTARLYNCIAPLDDPSVVFLGHAHSSNSFRAAEAQAIWATAYLDDSIKLPARDQAEHEVATMSAMSRRRYPTQGQTGDCIFFELIWYTDKLLDEVGLKSHRKCGWSHWVDPCLAGDFKDCVQEYRTRYLTQKKPQESSIDKIIDSIS